MATRRTVGIAAIVAAVCVATLLVLYVYAGRRQPPARFDTAFYVWQNVWTPHVAEALQQAAPRVDAFLVLVGEVDGRTDSLTLRRAQTDWSTLATVCREATPVLRANSGLKGRDSQEIATYLADVLLDAVGRAKAAGVSVKEVQLDYDCPTSALAGYADVLHALRGRLAGLGLSVTALPTWLGAADFRRVVRQTDYYVLQVHGLETPTTADAPVVLFDAGKVPGWLARASKLRVPFQVALPTYGYRVAYDGTGRFVGLAAEGSMPAPNTRTVVVDPAEVATVVSRLTAERPPWCVGIAWFRLPVEGDVLNWTWPTLESVMNGKAPETLPTVEVRRPRNDLFEVWINNGAGFAKGPRIRLTLNWNDASLRTYDALGGFEAEVDRAGGTVVLTGPAPEGREAVMAAWFVLEPGPQAALNVKGVEWAP